MTDRRRQGGAGARAGNTSETDALGALFAFEGSGSLRHDLDRQLAHLRAASGADVGELYLAEPNGSGMVLTCHTGPFRHAFNDPLRFDRGAGFPGRVLETGALALTADVRNDPSYVRERVKQAGFQAYLCAPLRYAGEVVGSVGLAYRHADDDHLTWARELVTRLGGPMGALVKAALAERCTEIVTSATRGALPTERVEALLRKFMDVSGAHAADVQFLRSSVRAGDPTPAAASVTLGPFPDDCRTCREHRFAECPVLAANRGEALYGRRTAWPGPCRSCAANGGLRICVPMIVDGEPIGLLRLWRRPDRGELPSADLVLVEAMATAASAVLDDHRKRLDAPVPVVDEPLWPRGPDEATTPHVAVRAFGPFEVRVDGVPLRPSDVGRRKALTLLKVLVAHEGRPVSRDALIEYLWPGGDPDTKTGQLYVLVHELRRRIEPPGGPEYVSCVEGRYQFDPSGAAWVDVRDYQALAQQAARAAERGDHPRALAAAEAAVELYRGEFMEDEPYADWCQLAREQLRESCLGLLRQLADQAAAAHAWMRSVAYLRAAARLEPLREETHRRLMEALWRSGRRTEALQQYRTCEDLLHTELGVAPLPATRRLHQAIRSDAEPPA